jgi:hypothetical protein
MLGFEMPHSVRHDNENRKNIFNHPFHISPSFSLPADFEHA